MDADLVGAVNALTARWLGRIGGSASSVVAAVGVWPLLAFLAEPAVGPRRAELAEALGIDAAGAMDAGRAVLDAVAACPAARIATALWTPAGFPLRREWADRLPPGAHGTITGAAETDQPVLDAWAKANTGGRIARFPVTVDRDTRLLLTGALAVETTWTQPFSSYLSTLSSGPWADDKQLQVLRDQTGRLDRVRVAATPCGPVTDLTVEGGGGLDVHLILADESCAPGDVLSAGVGALAAREAVDGFSFGAGRPGPGIEVRRESAQVPGDVLAIETVSFTIASSHDLTGLPEVFGLGTVRDRSVGHFPGISGEPLAIGQAVQNVTAGFGTTGFDAAATTVLAPIPGGGPASPYTVTRVNVTFDRPFAFYAVDRRTGLILVAGWVAQPERGNWAPPRRARSGSAGQRPARPARR